VVGSADPFFLLSEIPIDLVTDTSQVTSEIRGSEISRGPFLPNAEEVTRGYRQLAGEQASAGKDGRPGRTNGQASGPDTKPGGTRTVHLAVRDFIGSKEIANCVNVVNKEQILKEGAKGPEHLLDLLYPEPRSLDQIRTGSFDVVKRAKAHNS
jgi:hypothetical protein